MNWKKILSIIAAITIAAGIVFYFKKSVVSPPQKLKFGNDHLASLQREASLLAEGLSMSTADSLFDSSLNAARLFQEEGFVSPAEADGIVCQTTQAYVPYFVQAYKRTFENSDWSSRQLGEVRRKAKQLLNLKTHIDSVSVLSDEQRLQVDSANIILKQYDQACDLCKNTCYESLHQSESILKKAQEYARTLPLSNCKSLVRRLNNLRGVLEQSHYNYVKSQVNKLDNYRFYERSFFVNTLVTKAYNAIKDYKENAQRVYGNCRSVQSLEKQAKNSYDKAIDHYDSL